MSSVGMVYTWCIHIHAGKASRHIKSKFPKIIAAKLQLRKIKLCFIVWKKHFLKVSAAGHPIMSFLGLE